MAEELEITIGIRTLLMCSYDMGARFYELGDTHPEKRKSHSAVRWASEIGCFLQYGCKEPSRKKRIIMSEEELNNLVGHWHNLVVGLAMAHDKEEADLYEAAVDDCLTPVLRTPVKQLRELAAKLRDSLKADKRVPYLVWRGFESWVDEIVLKAPDQEVKELKTELAGEIVQLVEEDAKHDLPAAMIRALQWRSPEQLVKVKEVVEREKAEGRSARLQGRESCLFLECGGTVDKPEVTVQV